MIFCSFLYFTALELILTSITNAFIDENHSDLSVNGVADVLVDLIGADLKKSRVLELNEKLNRIKTYVVDEKKYAALLRNITEETDLNKTNFFNALYDRNHNHFLIGNESKSLYLKLKQKMNRDDITTIIALRRNATKIRKSARKTIGMDYIDRYVDYNNVDEGQNNVFDTIVDELLAEAPNDKHTYSFKGNDGVYWDPQGELEDLEEYHQHGGRRIFKGERTTIKDYPFMVSVHVMGRFWCGGALYWHDLVLTSAACLQLMHNNRFFRENPKVLQVRIGSNHSRIGGEMVDALEVYFHPSYKPRTLQNNIAIIRLRYHLYFNYHRVPKLISISHESGGVPSTSEVLLLGWGVKKLSQKMAFEPIFLQRKLLPVYPNVFCKEVYGEKFISSTMFCAGTMTTGEGACAHDAGGPAVIGGKLVGIISFGPTVCGFPNAPTVFTLVGAFADWIETVNESMPSYYVGKRVTTTVSPEVALKYLDFAQYTHKNSKYFGLHMTKRQTGNTDVRPDMPTTPRNLRFRRPRRKKIQDRD